MGSQLQSAPLFQTSLLSPSACMLSRCYPLQAHFMHQSDASCAKTGAAEETGGGGEALALLEAEAGEGLGAGSGEPGAGEAERARALEAGTAAKLLRAEGEFAAAKVDWEVSARLHSCSPCVCARHSRACERGFVKEVVSSLAANPPFVILALHQYILCGECCTMAVKGPDRQGQCQQLVHSMSHARV